MITSSHHQCQVRALPDLPEAVPGPCGPPAGTSTPDSDDARSAGLVLKAPDALSQEISPLANFWVTVSPSTDCSPVGTPSLPVAPPSLSQAALIAPRTTTAPVSGVQKITGLSGALNVLTRLFGAPPSASAAFGKPRSPVGPPADSYLDKMAPVTAWAPVAGE